MKIRLKLLGLICAAVMLTAILSDISLSHAAEPPAPPRRILRVHIVRGLWDTYYHLDRGLALAGVPLTSESWHWMGWGFGQIGNWDQHPSSGIDGFPDPVALASTDLVVVCNINGGAFGDTGKKALRDYVNQGGSVLFLGGRFAFGSEYAGSALEEMSPVTFDKGIDLTSRGEGLVLSPGPDAEGPLKALAWDKQPRVMWLHHVTPKPGTKVWMTAGKEPAMVAWTYGKGRVVLFAGTVLGDGPSGALAEPGAPATTAPAAGPMVFWNWNGWPVVMGQTIQWLTPANARGPANVSPEIAGLKSELSKAMEQDAEGASLVALAPKVEALAKQCRDQATANLIVQALVTSQGDLPAEYVPAVAAGLRLFAGTSWTKQARTLIDSGLQGKTAIGLRLLGAAKTPDALATLTWFCTNGKTRGAKNSGGGGRTDEMSLPAGGSGGAEAAAPTDPDVIRLGALEGLGNLADPAAIQTLQLARQNAADGRVVSSKDQTLDMLTPQNKLYEEAVMASVRCGEPAAVDPLFEAMLGNMNIVVRAKMEKNKTDAALKRVAQAVGQAIAWQSEMEESLLSLPDEALLAVATKIGASNDRRVVRIALAVFAGRPLTFDVRAELLKSRFPAVVDLVQEK